MTMRLILFPTKSYFLFCLTKYILFLIKLKNASHFIDVCNLNDSGESFQLVYSIELQLKCENNGLQATFFLS